MDNQNYYPNEQQSPQDQRPTRPDNYLVLAILCTLFCCLPFGIVSIIYAAKVDTLYNSGDYQGAQDASDNAKKYVEWGAVIGIVAGLAIVGFYAIVGLTAGEF